MSAGPEPSAIRCPACGEEDELRGERREGKIHVACGICGHTWIRDRDLCPRCGERAISDRREPLFQKARGTQQSIIGFRIVQECGACGFRAA